MAEIDLVARDGACVIFVEVRTRSSGFRGRAAECLHPRKLWRMRRAASIYLAHSPDTPHRIDLAAVTMKANSSQVVDFEWIQNLTG